FEEDDNGGDSRRRPEMRNEIRQSMAETADSGHDAGSETTDKGPAAAGELAVIRQGFGETHRNAGAERGGEADEESRPGLMGGEGRGEQRRQCRDRSVHQSNEARLDHLQEEQLVFRFGFFELGIGGEMLEAQAVSQ